MIQPPFAAYEDYADDIRTIGDMLVVSQPYYQMIGRSGVGRIFLYRDGTPWSLIEEPASSPPPDIDMIACLKSPFSGPSDSRFSAAIATNSKRVFVGAPAACGVSVAVDGKRTWGPMGKVMAYSVADSRFPDLAQVFYAPVDSGAGLSGGFGEKLAENEKYLAIYDADVSRFSGGVSPGAVYVADLTNPAESLPPSAFNSPACLQRDGDVRLGNCGHIQSALRDRAIVYTSATVFTGFDPCLRLDLVGRSKDDYEPDR